MAWVQALTAPTAGNVHCLARITRPETVAAITRRERGGHIAPANAATALAHFDQDFTRQYVIVSMSDALIDHASVLARTHALRGYDAVQLAAALEVWSQIPTLVLISADGTLNAAANRKDQWHAKVVNVMRSLGRATLVTTEEMLDELALG